MITTVMFGGACVIDVGKGFVPQYAVPNGCAAAGYDQPIKREKQHTKKAVVVEISFMIHPWVWAHPLAFRFCGASDTRRIHAQWEPRTSFPHKNTFVSVAELCLHVIWLYLPAAR